MAESNDGFTLDLTDYKETQGAYVNPGRYHVVVDDAENGESPQKKTKEITLWLRVVGGEFDGVTLVEHLYQSPGARFRTVEFLNAIGLKTTTKQKNNYKFRQMLNKHAFVDVEDNVYNNRTSSRVTSYSRFVREAGAAPAEDFSGLDEFSEPEGDGTNPDITDFPDDGGSFDLEPEAEPTDDDSAQEGPGNPASTFVGEVEPEAASAPEKPAEPAAAPEVPNLRPAAEAPADVTGEAEGEEPAIADEAMEELGDLEDLEL